MSFELIPLELRVRDQWVLWRLEERDGKDTKVPYRAREPFVRASSTDSTSWASFELAIAFADQADGVGFVFTADDPFAGIDLDEGLSEADRAAIMLALNSYAERSVSGVGVHVIVKASLNGYGRNRRGPFEVYDSGRYFVVTGDHIVGTPTTIEERQLELTFVLAQFLPKPSGVGGHVFVPAPVDLSDQELVEFIRDKYPDLWDGQWEGRYGSQSEADLSLALRLAWVTGNDAGRIDRLFRSSGLYRNKWERDDYRSTTIETAIARALSEGSSERSWGSDSVDSVDSETGVSGAGTLKGVGESGVKDSPTPNAPAPAVGDGEPLTESNPDSEADSIAAPEAASEKPFALPLREFIALEREEREPMLADVDGRPTVGMRSLVLLGALGGHGKTTWSVDLFLHMAAGVDYPPFTVPRPVSILLIENEGPEQLFADKLRARVEHFEHELKARLDVCTFDWGGFSLADDAHRRRLIAEIADKNYDLVFGDPLDSLGIEGVGSPEDTRKFLGLMKQTGLNTTVGWWLNTHPRKEETREALNEIAGAWGGKPDSVFLLRMLEDDRTQIRQPKLRWARRGKGPTLLYAFDPDTEAFSYLSDQAEDERDYFAEIRALLKDGGWRIAKEIAAPVDAGGIGANDKVVRKVLEEHPDVFESRTGDEAKALGRKPQATLWQLRGDDDLEHDIEPLFNEDDAA